jgi:hypothetical protein
MAKTAFSRLLLENNRQTSRFTVGNRAQDTLVVQYDDATVRGNDEAVSQGSMVIAGLVA